MDDQLGPRALARRRRILDAAGRLFVRQGIERSTVEHLLAEAGIARATFYRAFPSLDAVIEALYDEYEEHVLARLTSDLGRVTSADDKSLGSIIDNVFADERSRGPLARVIFREELRPGTGEKRQHQRVAKQQAMIGRWWEQHMGVPADDELILCLIMMLQSAGLMVVSPEREDALRGALLFIFRAVVKAYLQSQQTARRGVPQPVPAPTPAVSAPPVVAPQAALNPQRDVSPQSAVSLKSAPTCQPSVNLDSQRVAPAQVAPALAKQLP